MENSVTATIDRVENQIHDEPHAFCGKFTLDGWAMPRSRNQSSADFQVYQYLSKSPQAAKIFPTLSERGVYAASEFEISELHSYFTT